MKICKGIILVVVFFSIIGSNLFINCESVQAKTFSDIPEPLIQTIKRAAIEVAKRSIAPSNITSNILDIKKELKECAKKDINLKSFIAEQGFANVYSIGIDIFIDTLTDVLQETGAFERNGVLGKAHIDHYLFKEIACTIKNMALLDLDGQIIDSFIIVGESWKETAAAVRQLPEGTEMDWYLSAWSKLVKGQDTIVSYANEFYDNFIAIQPAG